MLALAYAAEHPYSTGPLILVGCGTFDLRARARMQKTIRQRMSTDIRTRLQDADRLANADERLKSVVDALASPGLLIPTTTFNGGQREC
jgi:pimeloyl-ACP methyl ester carboxylesterase